jgi:hypothetical protein
MAAGIRSSCAWLSLMMVLSAASVCQGSIDLFKTFDVDFTNAKDARAKATWSPAEKLSITKEGLGWDGEGAASYDGWIETQPVAVGLSWRPAQAVHVRVAIVPPPAEVVLNSGQKHTSYAGDVFVRYSPDMKHWSSWQVLQHDAARSVTEKKTPGRYYTGTVHVPQREREEYQVLLSEYSKLDVPWKSDEEAAVRWILRRKPDFFARHLPFVGYVEFLFEGSICGGQRIRSFHAELGCGMGGIHYPPRDKAAYEGRDSSPWRFKADEKHEAKPSDSKGPLPAPPPPNPQA